MIVYLLLGGLAVELGLWIGVVLLIVRTIRHEVPEPTPNPYTGEMD